ncbi:phosphatase PAP2 family protein [Tomitella biformata]|uniref:phosphatase PAP2 family protein n=1 Tax=Tomitella biformata TaxID=630403 RepID=UPI000467AC1F|nr:phosphatase PAP2 family protein [Tomitella biformata]
MEAAVARAADEAVLNRDSAALVRARWRWIAVAFLSTPFLVGIYILAVRTTTGQRLENAALRGADQASPGEVSTADTALDHITLYSLAGAIVVIGVIGLLRRKFKLTVIAVSVIVLGQVVTQGLKRFVLPRPDLVDAAAGYAHNSFPSGHTTIAMTVLVAVILVVPFRLRGLAMFVVMSWAVGIGAYTVTAKWHRASDTLGADAIAITLGSLAALVLLRRGMVCRADKGVWLLRSMYAVLFGVFGLITLVLGLVLLVVSAQQVLDETVEYNLFLASNSLAAAGSMLFGLLYWWTWRDLEVR